MSSAGSGFMLLCSARFAAAMSTRGQQAASQVQNAASVMAPDQSEARISLR